MRPLLLAFLLVTFTACRDAGPDLSAPAGLQFVMRADTLGMGDSMTIALRVVNVRGDTVPVSNPQWLTPAEARLFTIENEGALLTVGAVDTGTVWLHASASGVADSLRMRLVRIPFGVGAKMFADFGTSRAGRLNPVYYPGRLLGTCYTYTHEQALARGEDPLSLWVGAFVMDWKSEPMYRGATQWRLMNPVVADMRARPDSIWDMELWPRVNGNTTMQMRIGNHEGSFFYVVDTVNNCRNVRPLMAERAAYSLEGARRITTGAGDVYVW